MTRTTKDQSSGATSAPAPADQPAPSLEPGDGSILVRYDEDPPHYAAPAITTELRHMVALLESQEKGGFPQRLALTSALPGEGVTFVARSLAGVLANDLDRHVCLLELNWWGSDASTAGSRPGMADVVAGDLDVGDVLAQTTKPRLWYAPAGRAAIPQRPVLAKSERLGAVLDELAARFDHIVLDLPAVHRNGDAITLARHSEMCAIVVLHGVTADTYVRGAMSDLSGQTILGVILNKVSSSIPERITRLVEPW